MYFLRLGIMIIFLSISNLSLGITYITEDYPPYNYLENDQPGGLAVDMLRETLKVLGPKYQSKSIKVYPWARGYKMAQSQGREVVLFSTTRTKARENLFKWFGPIADNKVSIFGAKGSSKVSNIDDLKSKRFGVIRDDIGEQLIKGQGIPDSSIVRLIKIDQFFSLMDKRRIHFFVYGENVIKYQMKKSKIPLDKFNPVHSFNSGVLWFAVNKHISDAEVKKHQKALDSIKKNKGFLERMKKAYGIDIGGK